MKKNTSDVENKTYFHPTSVRTGSGFFLLAALLANCLLVRVLFPTFKQLGSIIFEKKRYKKLRARMRQFQCSNKGRR